MINKWLRWKGLFGFAIALVVLLLFFLLLVDNMIKSGIEYAGTRMVGAKVELDKAEFRFSPLGMALTRLRVTNPDAPLQNIVDIQTIRFNMDGLNLLRHKLLIHEMRIDGVRLNTPRRHSGAIKKAPAPAKTKQAREEKKDSGFKVPDVVIPDTDKILAREEIKTLKQAEDFKSQVKTSQQNWETIRDRLPGEKRVEKYSASLERVKKTDTKDIKQLAEAIETLKRLKKDIKSDVATVDSSYHQVSGDLAKLQQDMQALKQSPTEEYKRLLNKYAITPAGIGNISHLLFGSEAKKYTGMAMYWYKKLQPYLVYVDFGVDKEKQPPVDRHKGLDIRFKEYHPTADFFIKLAQVSVETQKGSFSGRINDITNEQNISRRPTTLQFSGKKMPGIGSIEINGRFNHINPAKAADQLDFSMRNYELKQYRLIDKPDISIYLDKAKSDITLRARRQNDRVQADFKSHIHSIQYNNKASGNELAMMFLSSINKTRDFNIYGKLHGTLSKYSTEVSSDLDNRLKANIQRHMHRRLADFRSKLRSEIDLKTRQPIHEAEGKLKDLNSMVKNDIAIRKAKLTRQYNQAKDELDRKERQQKDRLKSKVDTKLKGLMNRLR